MCDSVTFKAGSDAVSLRVGVLEGWLVQVAELCGRQVKIPPPGVLSTNQALELVAALGDLRDVLEAKSSEADPVGVWVAAGATGTHSVGVGECSKGPHAVMAYHDGVLLRSESGWRQVRSWASVPGGVSVEYADGTRSVERGPTAAAFEAIAPAEGHPKVLAVDAAVAAGPGVSALARVLARVATGQVVVSPTAWHHDS